MEKFIINFTPTGMIPTKSMTPFVPVSIDEVVHDVKEAVELGITMVHLHARDEGERPCYQKEVYERMIYGIRQFAPELIICVSTSGRTFSEFEKRANVLLLDGDVKPDMASLTLSSLNFNKMASINEPDTIIGLARMMKEKGIKAELEAFDLGMINFAKYLANKGFISEPYYFNLIMGNISCAQANLLSSGIMVSELPSDSVFSFGGIGEYQLSINSMAISMGYGVRVGLEDNIWFDKERTALSTNKMLLERILNIAHANQREIMTPSELRKRLGLCEGNGKYGVRVDGR